MDAAASGRAIRVGAAYNVFDGIELLEASIRSIRPIVSFVCVVYQSESNFGAKAAPASAKALQDLVRRGIVDELVHYSPQTFTNAEKVHLAAPNATPADMGKSLAVCASLATMQLGSITVASAADIAVINMLLWLGLPISLQVVRDQRILETSFATSFASANWAAGGAWPGAATRSCPSMLTSSMRGASWRRLYPACGRETTTWSPARCGCLFLTLAGNFAHATR